MAALKLEEIGIVSKDNESSRCMKIAFGRSVIQEVCVKLRTCGPVKETD